MPLLEITNRVISYVIETPAPCERSFCTTCGGRLYFLGKLNKTFPRRNDLIEGLSTMGGRDVIRICDANNCMSNILQMLDESEYETVTNTWKSKIHHDNDLAIGVLLWSDYGKNLDVSFFNEVITETEVFLINNKKHRNAFRNLLRSDAKFPYLLEATINEDIKREEEERIAAYRQARARIDYLEGLSRVSFFKRVHLIIEDKSIGYRDWRAEWSICNDKDLECIGATEVQKLIDLCESNQSYRWTDALKKLYDRRHLLRTESIQYFRDTNRHLSNLEQIRKLVKDFSVPIEHYPVELAQYMTPEMIGLLSHKEMIHITTLLRNTRLRVWKKVLTKCDPDIECT